MGQNRLHGQKAVGRVGPGHVPVSGKGAEIHENHPSGVFSVTFVTGNIINTFGLGEVVVFLPITVMFYTGERCGVDKVANRVFILRAFVNSGT